MATILVVDDQEITREVAVMMLDGHNVLQAGSGPEALEVLKVQTVDLVVSDIQMPGMSGFDLRDRVPDRKFLFMSGYVFNGDQHRVGNSPLLMKPFKMKEFIAEVEKILGG